MSTLLQNPKKQPLISFGINMATSGSGYWGVASWFCSNNTCGGGFCNTETTSTEESSVALLIRCLTWQKNDHKRHVQQDLF